MYETLSWVAPKVELFSDELVSARTLYVLLQWLVGLGCGVIEAHH